MTPSPNGPAAAHRRPALRPAEAGDEIPLWRQHFPLDHEEDLRRSRREFMKLLALVSGGFSLGSVGLVVKAAVAKVNHRAALPTMEIAGAADLKPGESLGFTMPDDVPALLVKTAEGQLAAYDRRCTHLSCPVLWNSAEHRIQCPCHKGAFDPATGEVLFGPPQRGLTHVTLETHAGKTFATGYETRKGMERRHDST